MQTTIVDSMMKIIIAGSRSFNDYSTLCKVVNEFLCSMTAVVGGRDDVEIVSGCAEGADKLGERYAKQRGFKVSLFPAKWDTYGKSAGYKRNIDMAQYADALVAFWDGKSKGTVHMIHRAKEYGLEVTVYKY